MPDHLDLALDLDGDRAALEALANEARRRLGSSTHHLRVGAAHLRVEFIGSASVSASVRRSPGSQPPTAPAPPAPEQPPP